MSAPSPPSFFANALSGVRHGFFGRVGGVSTGIYASLNAGTGSKDDAEAVRENRRRIAATFKLPPEQLIGVHQVHSPDVVEVGGPWTGERPHADALVTTTPNLALSILTADCAPVLFVDAKAGVIGAAHAGWKGALYGVLAATVEKMHALGARDISAAIGPCIHQPSYEVGPEFEAAFLAVDPDHANFFAAGAGDRRKFDLPGFCAGRLATLGVEAEIVPQDTYPNASTLFSHRRSVHAKEGDYGRNCAVICL